MKYFIYYAINRIALQPTLLPDTIQLVFNQWQETETMMLLYKLGMQDKSWRTLWKWLQDVRHHRLDICFPQSGFTSAAMSQHMKEVDLMLQKTFWMPAYAFFVFSPPVVTTMCVLVLEQFD